MTAIRLLAELHDAGIRFALNGDRIRLEPTRDPIPPPMMQRIADHKPEAVELLSSPEGDTLRVLLGLAIDEELPGGTVAALSIKDLRACANLPRPALRAFLHVLARSQRMAVGNVPEGWTHAAHCAGCGPVLLWRGAPSSVIACPWCWQRKAGRSIPKP
ncbi:MAG: hypothetical protein KF800_06650 [Lysobacter sp.]|nr:hypothetical protein [Lysobacter sp.]